jgi:hypothetical protein
MQITDIMNQYNRNLANGVETPSGSQGMKQVVSSLQEMAVGNVFEGSIQHMENGVATLGLADGKTVQARIDSGVTVRQGESMFFQVRSNNGMQIAIRPFSNGLNTNPTILNALKAANLQANAKMVTMVNTMMEQAMPIDKQSLAHMAKLVAGNSTMDITSIVQMAKLGIPVTEEMAAQFENYKSDQYAILDQLETIMETLPEQLADGGLSQKELLDLNRQMIKIFLGGMEQTEGADEAVSDAKQPAWAADGASQGAGGKTEAVLDGKEPVQAAGKEALLEEALNQTKSGIQAGKANGKEEALLQEASTLAEEGKLQENNREGILAKDSGKEILQEGKQIQETYARPDSLKYALSDAQLQQLSRYLSKIPELSKNPALFQDGQLSGELTSKEVLQLLEQAFSSDSPFSKQALGSLFSSKAYRALARNVMERQWLLRPEELETEHKVGELYQRLDRQMGQMERALKDFGQNTQQLSDTASNVRENIQFMNQLNQTYAYVQIPLKMAGQNAHSDLYVYTDKRKKHEKDGELTAFLHLDLDHLGSTDVSVKMRQKKVSTNFYLKDDISYQLLLEHLDELERRLENKGYQVKIHVSNQEEKVNFVEDMIKQGAPSAGGMVHRYSFDVRA